MNDNRLELRHFLDRVTRPFLANPAAFEASISHEVCAPERSPVGVDVAALRANAERAERGQRSLRELREYYRRLIGERRRHPGDDLISAMIHAHDRGQRRTGRS